MLFIKDNCLFLNCLQIPLYKLCAVSHCAVNQLIEVKTVHGLGIVCLEAFSASGVRRGFWCLLCNAAPPLPAVWAELWPLCFCCCTPATAVLCSWFPGTTATLHFKDLCTFSKAELKNLWKYCILLLLQLLNKHSMLSHRFEGVIQICSSDLLHKEDLSQIKIEEPFH